MGDTCGAHRIAERDAGEVAGDMKKPDGLSSFTGGAAG